MKILILNWRDIKNPEAGGSELYFHELAKRWIKSGNEVTIICGGWKNCKKNEIIDGIKIIRTGKKFTLYALAPLAYLKLKDKPDIIIDVENGIPFFTPLFSRKSKILHIHHVHKDVWFNELPSPLAWIGYFLETKIMPVLYRNIKILTISKGSKEEIEEEGFGKVLGVINPGIDFVKYKKIKKSSKPTILFLNRIKKYKGLHILLEAVKLLQSQDFKFDLVVAGDGDDLQRMKDYASENKLKNVTFLGRVSNEKKKELMQSSWAFINPSFKEGWGIVNIESNYFGTPVIGSNVSGIRDSVVDGKTGLLFKYGDSKELANKIKLILSNKNLRVKMEKQSLIWAKEFDWDSKAQSYLKFLKQVKSSE